jgi:hypothetical protein
MKRPIRAGFAVLAICGVLLPGLAGATIVLELPVEALAQRADRVVHARVVAQESRWSADGARIHTFSTLQVLADLKGPGPAEIVVRQIGGVVDGQAAMAVHGDAVLEVGEEIVAFLRHNPDRDPVMHLVGLAQGKFRVEGTSSEAEVVRDLSGLAFARRVQGRWLVDPDARPVERLSFQELVRAVRSGGGR